MPRNHYTQIDIMKGLAILGVVVMHSLYPRVLHAIGAPFWLWQAVPVFMVLLGMNLAMSLSRSDSATLAGVYTRRYWNSRWHRILVPFLIAFGISTVIAAVGYFTQPGYHVNLGGFTLVGQFPAGGPGNYFFTVLLQFVLVGPALWVVYRRWPAATLFGAFLADMGFEYWAKHSGLVAAHPYIQSASIFRFIAVITLGMWLSDGWSLKSRRNIVVLVGAAASLVYLAYNFVTGWTVPFVIYDASTMNFASFFYPALLVMVGMAALPASESGAGSHFLARAGRESYHTFLVQMLWFSSFGPPVARLVASALSSPPDALLPMLIACAINVAVCLAGGALFFRLLAPRPRSA